ncbi:alpha-L-fucosidase [Pseudalgibacter alginicilyticus]|uniref:alpha-L-fucosidase n=1 Tax=Pseudalgibacter alginicilyticus TaxID=1736674 RepID=UPI001B800B0C
MYEALKHYYPYLKERWGATPPEFGYKDIIPEFKAEKWNPEEWAELFAEVGAKYVVFFCRTPLVGQTWTLISRLGILLIGA